LGYLNEKVCYARVCVYVCGIDGVVVCMKKEEENASSVCVCACVCMERVELFDECIVHADVADVRVCVCVCVCVCVMMIARRRESSESESESESAGERVMMIVH